MRFWEHNCMLERILVLQDDVLAHARSLVRNQRVQRARNASVSLYQHLSHTQFRIVSLACNKGASGWLNVLPLQDEGFSLNKEEFRDALTLRYDKFIPGLPSRCPCGNPFNPSHAMDCKKGGFVHARHDNLRKMLPSSHTYSRLQGKNSTLNQSTQTTKHDWM